MMVINICVRFLCGWSHFWNFFFNSFSPQFLLFPQFDGTLSLSFSQLFFVYMGTKFVFVISMCFCWLLFLLASYHFIFLTFTEQRTSTFGIDRRQTNKMTLYAYNVSHSTELRTEHEWRKQKIKLINMS